jgi:AraC-like DNA-binding protein
LRTAEIESTVDIMFDCPPSQGAIKRQTLSNLNNLQLESLSGSVIKTATGFASVAAGRSLLVVNRVGTLLVKPLNAGPSRLVVIPPKSVIFVRGNIRLQIQAARGEHLLTAIAWDATHTPLLDFWVAEQAGHRTQTSHARQIGCQSIQPQFTSTVARLDEAIAGPPEVCEPLVFSVAYEMVAKLMSGQDQVELASVPPDLPQTVKDLTMEVRQQATLAWPLKEAADRAGYSPFHFSRVFKQMVGFGFHEYVDRCRTQMAVDMLCNTDSPIDQVASACGFGTTQGLRESVKEYLGLVPSELRNSPF